MIAERFVMLGKTVPEATSDGRLTVCTAGYDLELRKPLRIYPLAKGNCPNRWSVARIPLERNAKDSREESWKIKGDRSPQNHSGINENIEIIDRKICESQQRDILQSMSVRSLNEANRRKMSLCVIFPTTTPKLDFTKRKETEIPQLEPTPDLFGNYLDKPVEKRFPYHPRIIFDDDDGEHNLMLREWGCYELMRKYGRHANAIMDESLKLDLAPPLLCGNLAAFRNSWLVISVFHGSAHLRPHIINNQPSLFDSIKESEFLF